MLQRPSSSSVIATVALVFALGGTAFGATTLLTGADVQDGSLTGRDIRDGSLRAADFSRADLPLLKPARRARVMVRGSRGPKGDSGPPGAAGPAGAPAALPSVSATGTA